MRVESIVREYPAVDEFQIYLWTKDGIRDEIAVRCEVRSGHEDHWEAVARQLQADLSTNTEGLGFHVERVPGGSLPRFELKAKRVLDERIVKGSR